MKLKYVGNNLIMTKKHRYNAAITWTGNTGSGTKSYQSYERNHRISIEGKPDISGSSDSAFRGDNTCYNPENLLLASVSACHMLWFLHLCSTDGVIVTDYLDKAEATLVETDDGGGHFEEVILKPFITIAGNIPVEQLDRLHHKANQLCFIANSCNFPVRHRPDYRFI
jgi:organic hydroperoxide reductase OsmC/OhrA